MNTWCVNLKDQYMDLNKLLDNDILSSMILLFLLGLKKTLLTGAIYLKVNESKFIFLIMYVDDILLETNDLSLLY